MNKNSKHSFKKLSVAMLAAVTISSTILPSMSYAQVSTPSSKFNIENENLFTKEQLRDLKVAQEKASKMKGTVPELKSSRAADKKITTLMLYKKNSKKESANLKFTSDSTANNPYQGGELVLSAQVPLEGKLNNKSGIVSASEHIRNWENGNFGARMTFALPEGVDAKKMVQTINWEKSNQTATADFTAKILGVETLVWDLHWGIKWNRDTITYNSSKPNEFSMMVTGIKKSEVSQAEWDKYKPLNTLAALTAAGTMPFGDKLAKMTGTGAASIYFDMSKYKGNTDDVTKNKELTTGKLFPSKDRKAKATYYFIDANALVAGAEGQENINQATVRPGHEYDNPFTSESVSTWDSYLSIWDREEDYNTNKSENDLVTGQRFALPGKSIFDRSLQVKKGDDFNAFEKARFNRVINYYTHSDVTKGNVGDVSHTDVTHTPDRIGANETDVTYSGSINYTNGDERALIPNVLHVKNQPVTDGAIIPDAYTIGDTNITGDYTGDVSQLELFINGVSVAKGGILKEDAFTFYVANQKITALDKVTLNAYDKDGKLLQENVPVKVKAPEIETHLTANNYKISPSNQYVTGTHSKNVDKIKLFVNGADRMTAAGNNNGEGQYKIYAYDFIKNASDNVVVKALDKDGKVIKETKVNVEKEESVQTYLTANNYKIAPNSQYVSGTHSTDVDKIKLFVNGVDRMTTGANNNGAQGQYRIYAYDFIKSTSDKVVVKALNKSGQVIKETKVNITQDTGSITASNFKISTDELINGTFTGNIAVVKLYVDGVARNQVRPTGSNYSLYAAGYVTSASQNVVVTGFDANGIQIASQKVNVSN